MGLSRGDKIHLCWCVIMVAWTIQSVIHYREPLYFIATGIWLFWIAWALWRSPRGRQWRKDRKAWRNDPNNWSV